MITLNFIWSNRILREISEKDAHVIHPGAALLLMAYVKAQNGHDETAYSGIK